MQQKLKKSTTIPLQTVSLHPEAKKYQIRDFQSPEASLKLGNNPSGIIAATQAQTGTFE
jgi:hypothetical protein